MFTLLRKKPGTAPVTDVQKIIIPRGLINPLETTVIEIPANLQSTKIVIAKPKPHFRPWASNPNTEMKMKTSSTIPPRECLSVESLESPTSDTDTLFTCTGIKSKRNFTKEASSYPGCTKTKAPQHVNASLKNKLDKRQNMDDSGRKKSKNRQHELLHHVKDCKSTTAAGDREKPLEFIYKQAGKQNPAFESKDNAKTTLKTRAKTDHSVLKEKLNRLREVTQLETILSSNRSYQFSDSSSLSVVNDKDTIKSVLDDLEMKEFDRIRKDLKDFQTARRKLIMDATNLQGRALIK